MTDKQLDNFLPRIPEVLAYHNDNYDIRVLCVFSPDRKLKYNKNEKGVCRFCGKSEPEVSFKQEAHAISEFVGNHKLLHYPECDSCNKFFSETCEKNCAIFLKPDLTFGQISGKSKKNVFPSYKTKKHTARLDTSITPEGIPLFSVTGFCQSDILQKDKDNGECRLNIETEKYIPVEVYRCFVKWALSILPENEKQFFTETFDMLRRTNYAYGSLCVFKQTRITSVDGYAFLLKRKNSVTNVPYMSFVIGFGFVQYQIFLPCQQKDCNLGKMRLHDILHAIFEQIDLSGKEQITRKDYLPMKII